MRSLLAMLAVVCAPVVFAQPGLPYHHQPLLTPSILHQPIRTGMPVPDTYYLTDTIVVTTTGHVKLDGGCSGGTPLYGFQRKEGAAWVDYLPPMDEQLCCGMPSAAWYQHPVALVPAHVALPAHGKPWVPGTYRAVVALVGEQELVGAPFTVVAAR